MRKERDTATPASRAHAVWTTETGPTPSTVVIGDLCLDLNEEGGRVLGPAWGSPALFIARELQTSYGLTALVSGSYGTDLLGLLGDFRLDRGPDGLRSPSYRNVVEAARRDTDSAGCTPPRVQYWRPSDREPAPISRQALDTTHDLLYFCPLIPDLDRAADIAAIRDAHGGAAEVRVLLAQGLMRTSGTPGGDSYRPVLRRDIGDEEAASWSCFDIVVFSDDDQPTAVERATRWSASSPGTGFIVTRGHLGATLCIEGTATPISTRPLLHPATTVGAGDVFAAVVGVEFHQAHVVAGMPRSSAMYRAAVRATAAASAYVRSGPAPARKGRSDGSNALVHDAMMAE